VIPPFGVNNGPEIRKLLRDSAKVLAVLQGHCHWGNYQEIAGLHYCTLSAVVEGSGKENDAYATMDIFSDDTIRITGFRKQKSYAWGKGFQESTSRSCRSMKTLQVGTGNIKTPYHPNHLPPLKIIDDG
jgi:hypothetical protein